MIPKTATLLLNPQTAQNNLQRVFARITGAGRDFRPHFKTHQSRQIGRWFRDLGIRSIAVSSVKMAEYFAADGWGDITLAIPVNRREIDEIIQLQSSCRLQLVVESPSTVAFLSGHLQPGKDHPVWIKLDTGYHRAGLWARETDAISKLIGQIQHSPLMTFAGFLIHDGHTYQARNPRQVHRIHQRTVRRIRALKKGLRSRGIRGKIRVSHGDTPSCSLVEDWEEIDEIRCGNFIFYDLMQQSLGACRETDIALALVAPVIAKNPRRREIILHCGAIHLSKERISNRRGEDCYGRVVIPLEKGWGPSLPDTRVTRLSQEHAVIQTTPGYCQQIQRGDLLGILPVHSCLAVDSMRTYYTLDGKEVTTLNASPR